MSVRAIYEQKFRLVKEIRTIYYVRTDNKFMNYYI